MGQDARRRGASHKGDDASQPCRTLKGFSREELKKTLLENLHCFDYKNLNFWKFALGVSDEEFNRYAKGNFRFGLRKFIG
jgi:hypothetical protein